MVKGKRIKDDQPEHEEERVREQYYYTGLQAFEGVEGYAYGIIDELRDLGMLLETLGLTVRNEEREFRQIEREEFDEETRELTTKVLENWHKKMYRQFTYKSMIMLIHTVFENALASLFNYLTEEGRIQIVLHKKSVLDILKSLKNLDPSIEPLIDRVRAFNFVRNRIAHNDGYYNEFLTDYDAFKKLVSARPDIEIKKLHNPKEKLTHRMQIIQSTVIREYLEVMKQIFTGLIRGAHKLEYKALS